MRIFSIHIGWFLFLKFIDQCFLCQYFLFIFFLFFVYYLNVLQWSCPFFSWPSLFRGCSHSGAVVAIRITPGERPTLKFTPLGKYSITDEVNSVRGRGRRFWCMRGGVATWCDRVTNCLSVLCIGVLVVVFFRHPLVGGGGGVWLCVFIARDITLYTFSLCTQTHTHRYRERVPQSPHARRPFQRGRLHLHIRSKLPLRPAVSAAPSRRRLSPALPNCPPEEARRLGRDQSRRRHRVLPHRGE